MSETAPSAAETRRIAEVERDRVRFEEEALELSDQVYRVARRLSGSREEAEDLVQDTYARAFRAWQQYQPGTNLRAWLLRILTNLNIDRGRRSQRSPDTQPLEEGDYFLYNKLESSLPDENPDEERVIQRLSQNSVVESLAEVPHDFRDTIVLVDIGEFSYADAAQILDIPVGTVMSRLHRGAGSSLAAPRRQEGGDRLMGCGLRGDWRDDDAALHGRHAHRTTRSPKRRSTSRRALRATSATASRRSSGTSSGSRPTSRCPTVCATGSRHCEVASGSAKHLADLRSSERRSSRPAPMRRQLGARRQPRDRAVPSSRSGTPGHWRNPGALAKPDGTGQT